ncbi:unnamed protein product [Gemmataceae bacterium]|nr:unnamed protein product [Gemmataceae bacterium]VTU02757.1 unnamed protein product [Gemmataceae bacterium]
MPCCGKQIRTTLLMCPHHWFKVPKALRDHVLDVWGCYLDGTAEVAELRAAQEKAIAAIPGQGDTIRRPADETLKGGAL